MGAAAGTCLRVLGLHIDLQICHLDHILQLPVLVVRRAGERGLQLQCEAAAAGECGGNKSVGGAYQHCIPRQASAGGAGQCALEGWALAACRSV